MEYSYFDRFSSKIKRINIPVPSFNEGTSRDSRNFSSWYKNLWNYFVVALQSRPKEYFIGRDIIIERLKTWLLKDRDRGASYLVTGYRGMGKTCFVNQVIEQLVSVVDNIQNVFAYFCFIIISFWPILWYLFKEKLEINLWDRNGDFNTETLLFFLCPIIFAVIWWMTARWPRLRESLKKFFFYNHVIYNAVIKEHCWISLSKITPREWNRINNLIFGGDKRESSYSRLCVKVNLAQEILREKDILSVLTYQLYNRWRRYSQCYVITDFEKALSTAAFSFITQFLFFQLPNFSFNGHYYITICLPEDLFQNINNCIDVFFNKYFIFPIIICILSFAFYNLIFSWRRRSVRRKLKQLKKSVDASREHRKGFFYNGKLKFTDGSFGNEDINTYKYDVADTRVIESQLIEILDYISSSYLAPTLYFVFDELDKIEDIDHDSEGEMPEYSNERNFPGGGASRRRKHTVMKLLANMKYFTTTAKAKFIFIAGREMYDGYLADFTDREAAASSLFDGVIYVESFCKNEKSDRNVTYNAETYIARQILPRTYIKERIIKELIECKLKGTIYDNIDIDLRMYYEYLIMQYAHCAAKVDKKEQEQQQQYFEDARKCIDRVIILLYHFSVYLFQISNGSPKKMRINFTNYVRLIKNPKEFRLPKKGLKRSPLEGSDLDILTYRNCKYLLTFTEKEQRVIGFIHYISFPINQIISNADRFSDKLLVSASFLINHIYKFHKGGFSWRNLEQTPELLEVYKIPEFRSFINSILNYLLQTHMIMIYGGLYDYKFRKQISEEISIASKTSEEVSAIYNFTLDDSQSVKRHYLSLLEHIDHYHKNNGTRNNSSMAAYHHILGDLYMSDEEYNNALSQYKLALNLLYEDDNFTKLNEHDPKLQDPKLKNPRLILSIIRNHLKIGLAYEKRRSNLSAYAAYEDIIALLFHYRDFNEKEFGLKFLVKQRKGWPEHETDIYLDEKDPQKETIQIEPIIEETNTKDNSKGDNASSPLDDSQDNNTQKIIYKTRGSRIISDFSNLVTPEKHEVLQRLSLIGDTKFVFQAMLAKLFVIEKIELGGITRENLDVIEGEFRYLHLATNVHEKFIIASDYYRRLGDIMYYKNGLIGFNFSHDADVEKSQDLKESFVDSLYYYGFDIKSELHDYCRKKKCFQLFPVLLKCSRFLSKDDIEMITDDNVNENIIDNLGNAKINLYLDEKCEGAKQDNKQKILEFWTDGIIEKKIKKIPLEDVEHCNKKRKECWGKNQTLPCYACRFYHHSLEILMNNWIGVDFKKGERKEIGVLRQIVLRGSAKSSRQNFNLQFAEVLDTLGNTMFSCSSAAEEISYDFFTSFMYDAGLLIEILDNDNARVDLKNNPLAEFYLLRKNKNGSVLGDPKNHLESSLLYYLEASFLFRVCSERKKAVGSLQKIIKILLNYLRVTERGSKKDKEDVNRYQKSRVLIGEMIYEIKKVFFKQCLILLYNHYNFINVMEIQRLKWIFYTDWYEGISLTQLSLFPDIEEIMLNYFEILKLCVILDFEQHSNVLNEEINVVRKLMSEKKSENYSFEMCHKWHSIRERNVVFNSHLITLYNNISMGVLRNESTVYGRILSLRFKSKLNEHILRLAFPDYEFTVQKQKDYSIGIPIFPFLDYFGNYDSKEEGIVEFEWKDYFKNIEINNPIVDPRIDFSRLFLLEYLIKDSIFCLTEVLETVTPYTTTTLFTDAFMAGIYFSLYKWSNLFEELFLYYKVFDTFSYKHKTTHIAEEWYLNDFFENYDLLFKKNTKVQEFKEIHSIIFNSMDTEKIQDLAERYNKIWNCNNISERFYNSVVRSISKPNVYYTLKNYAGEMSLHFYRRAKEINREGKAYKDMINSMYFLDDDLKNDTIQFDLAVERFRINSDDIDNLLNNIKKAITPSIYDVDRFCINKETELPLSNRFDDLHINIYNN